MLPICDAAMATASPRTPKDLPQHPGWADHARCGQLTTPSKADEGRRTRSARRIAEAEAAEVRVGDPAPWWDGGHLIPVTREAELGRRRPPPLDPRLQAALAAEAAALAGCAAAEVQAVWARLDAFRAALLAANDRVSRGIGEGVDRGGGSGGGGGKRWPRCDG